MKRYVMFSDPVVVGEDKIIGVLLETIEKDFIELATVTYRDLVTRELWHGSEHSGQLGRCFCDTFGKVENKEDGTQEFSFLSENGLWYSPDCEGPSYRNSYPKEFQQSIDFNGFFFIYWSGVIPPRYLKRENFYDLILEGAKMISHGGPDVEKYPINKI